MDGFKRSLTLLDAIMLVSGSMIGSGIFIVSAGMLRELGSPLWLLVAWGTAGLLTVMAALSYGELAAMMPKAGGQYVFIQRAFGRLPAFLYGWTVFTVIQTGVIAAVGVAFAKFTAVFFPVLGEDHILMQVAGVRVSAAQMLAVCSVVLLTWVNARGVRNGKLLQTVLTVVKIAALLGLILLGLFGTGSATHLWDNLAVGWQASAFDPAQGITRPLSGVLLRSALGVAMVGSLFSSDAWNNVTFIAGEVKDPQRNVPRSLFLGTLLVTTLYVAANLAYLSLLPIAEIQGAAQDRVGTVAMARFFGDAAVWVMAALIMVSTFGCNNGIILSGARLYYAMAQDGLFFRKAARLNAAGVPAYALWAQCIWACILCFSGHFGDLLSYVTFASLAFYLVTVLGLFRLRKKEPDAPRPYRVWGYPYMPALYVVCAGLFCLNLLWQQPKQTGAGVLIVLLGALVYFGRDVLAAKREA